MKKYGMIASKTRTKIENEIFNIIFELKFTKMLLFCFLHNRYDNNINSLKSKQLALNHSL